MDVRPPHDVDPERFERLKAEEKARAQDLQRAGKCDDVAQVDGPERRVVFQSLGHLARGDAEGA